ncbi:hypothetical protein DNX92_23145, partial [Salmonella enterica subsp. enterica]|nr:hypothetical protein [Salmonella enterica subsp. enterica serovar Richmond]
MKKVTDIGYMFKKLAFILLLFGTNAQAGHSDLGDDTSQWPFVYQTSQYSGEAELSAPQEKRYELAYYHFLGKYFNVNLLDSYVLVCAGYPTFQLDCISPEHIAVGFTEQKSGARHIAILGGYLESFEPSTKGRHYNFLGHAYSDSPQDPKARPDIGVGIFLDDSEIRQFPSGGVWKASLELRQVNISPAGGTPSWTYIKVNITLNLTDSKNIRIWFPQSHGSTTSVALSSRSPHVTVDACLYDGYNSNSNRLDVMFNSQNAGPDNTFKLARLSGSGHLPYQVRVAPPDNPGA